ncbi:hypothetical protein GCM10010433_51650 [Streptomyces pulveraceus]
MSTAQRIRARPAVQDTGGTVPRTALPRFRTPCTAPAEAGWRGPTGVHSLPGRTASHSAPEWRKG